MTLHAVDDTRFEILVDGVKDYAIVMLDTEGRVVSWNSGAERIMGYRSAEIVGESCARFYLAEDVAARKHVAALRAATANARFENEGWQIAKGDRPFWANVVLTALQGAAGDALGYAMVTSDFTERRKFEDDLALAHERLRALAAHVNASSELEKERLAREIHDVLGQELTMLKLDAAWIVRRLSPPAPAGSEDVVARAVAMMQQIDSCVQTVRRIATGLRPRLLDDLGLVAAIDWQVRDFQRRLGISVALLLPDLDAVEVDREKATALFRILQELLTNVARHAEAHNVRVTLSKEETRLVLDVEDDGRGVTDAELSSPAALGILGMRERVALFGGELDIRGAGGGGTHATVRMPVSFA